MPPLAPSARLLLLSGCALLALPAATAAEPAPSADDTALHRIEGIFDTDLPKTEKKGRIRFLLHPHLGDFTRRDYVRLPLGLRVGVNDHVEVSATVEPYLHHGLRSGNSGNGIGSVEFGGKYAFKDWLQPALAASAGLNVRVPVGRPPLDLTDGHNHYAPYLVVSHKSPTRPGLTRFASTTLDVMDESTVAGSFRKNAAHSTSLIFATGFVLDRYPYHYTLEAGYQTTSLVGRDNKQFVFIKPGFAWDLPRRATFNSSGRWLLGFSFKITEGPDGTRIDSGGKIRGEFSLRRMFGGKAATR